MDQETAEDIKRHFDVVAASLRSDIRLVIEGLGANANRLDSVESRLGSLETRSDGLEIRFGALANRFEELRGEFRELRERIEPLTMREDN